jgi:hypothetical protein
MLTGAKASEEKGCKRVSAPHFGSNDDEGHPYREYTLRIRGEWGLNVLVTKDLHDLSYYWKRGITNPWFDVLPIRLMVSQK